VAPPGYGKSTLLRQWARRHTGTSTWLTLDVNDNDPVLLLSYLTAAFDRILPVDPDVFRQLTAPLPSVRVIASMLGAVLMAQDRVALVLDDVHMLENPDCHDIIGTLIEHAPPGVQIATAGRRPLPLPVQRIRAEGRIVEVGPDELALDQHEAAALLHGVGVELTESQVHELVGVTEGWAVPIYLAARSLKARGNAAVDIAKLAEHRHVAAYVWAELLSAQSDETVEFLTRSSLLEQMSGALCDAALVTTGSAARLEALAESNLLVVPLDDRRKLYRYHQMFRGLLRAELALRDPDLLPQIRRRAGTWCEANGLPDAAVGYTMAAGDADHAAQLVLRRVLPMYRAGRIVTLRRWFDWFDDHGHMNSHPTVAVVGAWLSALVGHAATAERWADVAERGAGQGQLPDGHTSIAGLRALLRAGLCRHGVEQMLADAEHAEQLITPASSWRALTLALVGISRMLTGDTGRADEELAQAIDIAGDDGALPTASVALGQRALIAFDRGEHDEARSLIARACAMVDEGRSQEAPTNAFVLAVAARITRHEGDVAQAEQLLAGAQRLRPALTYALPFLAVQTRLELIRVLLAAADAAGARTMLREADAILRRRPLLGILGEQADELRAQIARIPVGAIGASALTGAELRLLPLLRTHRTFREIGERLYVSPHTVKTQAISIYRKLGVSSRGGAVERAAELGLLSP